MYYKMYICTYAYFGRNSVAEILIFEKIKDMQASIEVSTYEQVKTILMFGVYHISCKYHQILHSSKEVFTLRIKEHSNLKQIQTLYTLNDLKDLESKIILIRDSRSSTANGKAIEAQISEDMQEPRHNISVSSDTSLYEKLSSKEVDGFLDVRISYR